MGILVQALRIKSSLSLFINIEIPERYRQYKILVKLIEESGYKEKIIGKKLGRKFYKVALMIYERRK